MRLGIGVRRRENGRRVYIAGRGGRWQNEVLLRLRCGERVQDKQNRGVGVGVFGIGVGQRVGFSPRILSSRLFLPLFVLYLFFYICKRKLDVSNSFVSL